MEIRTVFKRCLLCGALAAICVLTYSPSGLLIFLFLVLCTFYMQRALWRHNRRCGRRRKSFYPTTTSLGNAFQTLQILAEPQIAYVIEEKDADEVDENDDGQSEDGTFSFNRQLRRIRNGERIDRLTVRRPLLEATLRPASPKA